MKEKEIKNQLEIHSNKFVEIVKQNMDFPIVVICEKIDMEKSNGVEIHTTGELSCMFEDSLSIQQRIHLLEKVLKIQRQKLAKLN